MLTITDTATRIVRYHEDSGILECITFETPDVATQLSATRTALSVKEWSELKKALP